jgi:chromosome segregation ATPase
MTVLKSLINQITDEHDRLQDKYDSLKEKYEETETKYRKAFRKYLMMKYEVEIKTGELSISETEREIEQLKVKKSLLRKRLLD